MRQRFAAPLYNDRIIRDDELIVDLFAGGGGASTGMEAALGRPIDLAINHDPVALAAHKANHPWTEHLEANLWEVRPREATRSKPVGLLWASPDCFPAGTLIVTSTGLRPIEAIAPGDLVLTHRSRWRSVASTMAKESDTVEVRGYGHYGIVTTPNHPFYSKHITKRYPDRKSKTGKRRGALRSLVENPYWPAAEAMEGKLWATPHVYPESTIPTCAGAELSDSFFYFVGRWLGDGSFNKGDVEICCGLHETKSFAARIAETPLKGADGQIVPHRLVDHGSSKLFVWGNAPLTRWLATHFGSGCEGKRLPVWCLSMQTSWRRALLDGYVDADGHRDRRTVTSSVSKALSLGIRLLAVTLGHAASLYRQPGQPGQIEGRRFIGQDLYRVAWTGDRKHETVFRDSSHTFFPVREVVPTGACQLVFSLEVEDDESYVADGIVVHNCRHHSVAKGGAPRSESVRSLPNVVVRWVKAVRPRMLALENVIELQSWGPLDKHGKRIKARAGETFRRWKRAIERLGYVVEHRILDASLYGARTRRRRFFLIARCDGVPIAWPDATHGEGRLPVHTAAECIDWALPVPSIFERKKPLAEKTLWRIAQGIRRFVLESDKPFIVKVNHGKMEARVEPLDEPLSTVTATQRGHAIVSPTLIQTGQGERKGQRARVPGLHKPLGTVVACGQRHALVGAYLSKYFGDPQRKDGKGGVVLGSELQKPIGTVTTRDHHAFSAVFLAKYRGTSPSHPGCADINEPMPTISAGGQKGGIHVAEVRAFLTAYYSTGTSHGQKADEPLRTIRTKHCLGIVTVSGIDYQIVDIGLRMLQPHELLRAQFGKYAEHYDLSAATTVADQVRLIGNSVCPELAEAVVAANMKRDVQRAA